MREVNHVLLSYGDASDLSDVLLFVVGVTWNWVIDTYVGKEFLHSVLKLEDWILSNKVKNVLNEHLFSLQL